MQLVVDANVVFSALIADATTRTLLIDLDHEHYTPEFVHTEIRKHRSTIEEKSGVSASAVEVVLDTLFDELVLIPDTDLRPHLQTAHAAIGDTDPDDVPYLATALAIDAAVWSDDGDFTKQSQVEVYTTSDIVAEFGTE